MLPAAGRELVISFVNNDGFIRYDRSRTSSRDRAHTVNGIWFCHSPPSISSSTTDYASNFIFFRARREGDGRPRFCLFAS